MSHVTSTPEPAGLGWPETYLEKQDPAVSRETSAEAAGLGWPE
jgi:hypothetical protein